MTSCAEIKESIGPWLDRELPEQRAETVRSHLAICADCAEEQHQLIKLGLAMRAVLESESACLQPGPFWNRLRQRIESRGSRWRERLAESVVPLFNAPSFAWAVPAVILLLIGALYFDVFSHTWSIGVPRNNFATVESIDAYGRDVALLREHESKTTVIWLYQNPENESEGAGETVDKGPAF
jgi:hypothetical protein